MSRETIFFLQGKLQAIPTFVTIGESSKDSKRMMRISKRLTIWPTKLPTYFISNQPYTLCWIRNYFQVILSIRDWFPILHEIGISWNGLNQTVLDQLGHDQIQGNTFSSSDARLSVEIKQYKTPKICR